MGIEDYWGANESAPPLTRETLNKAFEAISKQGSQPRHDCRFDGHVAQLMTTRCVYCHEEIRSLTPDENHIRLGEFELPGFD